MRLDPTRPDPSRAPSADGLTQAGLVPATLHEIYAACLGEGASALGFAALLTQRFTAERPLLWFRRLKARGAPYGPGLAELGLDPGRILFVAAPDERALLRAGADAAHCAGVGAILIEAEGRLPLYDLTASRRLRLAAGRSGVTILMVRTGAAPIPSAAETRWEVAAAPSSPSPLGGEDRVRGSGVCDYLLTQNPLTPALSPQGRGDFQVAPGPPAFAVQLLRRRGGPAGMEMRLEWNRDRACFRESALSGALFPLSAGGSAADRAAAFA
ncbi:ImuA family protein [Sphingosinicella sp.]|uniref:ImuA family protein n=1 Tax=Sphingosinicella sp. TaxID=1917971 RepID=UPI00403832E6